MKTQLFLGTNKPDERDMLPIQNRQLMCKPYGGLWTSSYNEDFGSDWLQWSIENDWYTTETSGWLLEPHNDARVLVIDSNRDLEEKLGDYIITMEGITFTHGIDFEAIQKKWDAIHLTKEGEIRTRFSEPYNLYGWDCESTIWFRWCFEKVEKMKKEKIIK